MQPCTAQNINVVPQLMLCPVYLKRYAQSVVVSLCTCMLASKLLCCLTKFELFILVYLISNAFVITKLSQELLKEDDSLEALLENVVGLRQIVETSREAMSQAEHETEPTLPSAEPLQTQFNNRYQKGLLVDC